MFIFSHAREKGTKRVRYPQGPLDRGMQLKSAEAAIFKTSLM